MGIDHRDLGKVEIRGECWCGSQKSERTGNIFIVGMGHRDLGRVEIRGECWCVSKKSEEIVYVFIVGMDHRDLGYVGRLHKAVDDGNQGRIFLWIMDVCGQHIHHDSGSQRNWVE